jgi:ATP-dependent DNA ligase
MRLTEINFVGPLQIRFSAPHTYLRLMPKFEFCLPTNGKSVPAGPEWFHEIKFDGYRLRVERDGNRVWLITRGGYDWTKRFPWIAEAALKNRRRQFVIDGEVWRGIFCPGAERRHGGALPGTTGRRNQIVG